MTHLVAAEVTEFLSPHVIDRSDSTALHGLARRWREAEPEPVVSQSTQMVEGCYEGMFDNIEAGTGWQARPRSQSLYRGRPRPQ